MQSSPSACGFAQHWWALASLLSPLDSQLCHVLERALTINSIPVLGAARKGYVFFIGLTDAYSLL